MTQPDGYELQQQHEQQQYEFYCEQMKEKYENTRIIKIKHLSRLEFHEKALLQSKMPRV